MGSRLLRSLKRWDARPSRRGSFDRLASRPDGRRVQIGDQAAPRVMRCLWGRLPDLTHPRAPAGAGAAADRPGGTLITAELRARAARPPDYEAETRALTGLAEAM